MSVRLFCSFFLCLWALSAGGAAHANGRTDVLTSQGDRQRTGWFSSEHDLSPAALKAGRFGKLWESPELDGFGRFPARLYASPLYVDGLTIQDGPFKGKRFRVVIAASSSGFVYAINAAAANGVAPGAILWKTQLDAPCELKWDASTMGIVGTPIIDQKRERLYVANCGAETGFHVYGLNLATGQVLDGWPVSISEDVLSQPSINNNPRYRPPPQAAPESRFDIQRGALNLSPDDRYLYIAIGQGRGWVVAVDTSRHAVASAYSTTPLEEDSVGGIWASTGVSVDVNRLCSLRRHRGEQQRAGGRPPLRNWSQSVLMFAPVSGRRTQLAGGLYALQLLPNRGGGCRPRQQWGADHSQTAQQARSAWAAARCRR